MKIKYFLCLIFVSILAYGGIGHAADPPVKVTGKSIHGDTNRKISYIEGNVRIVQGSTILTTDKATIYMDKKEVILESRVKLVNTDGTINCDYLDYDLRKKNGSFKGNVVMQRKEGKGGKKDPKNGRKSNQDPFTLHADELQLDTNTKDFTAVKGKFEHKEFNGTADEITYQDANQAMVFQGNVYLKRTKEGDVVRGEEVQLNLQDKSFVVTNNVSVEFEVKDDEDSKSGKSSGKPKNDKGKGPAATPPGTNGNVNKNANTNEK